MPYQAPVNDTKFILDEVLNIDGLGNIGNFAECTKETRDQIIDEMARFTDEILAPLNAIGDHEGCIRNADGSVTTPKGFKDAYKQYTEMGWTTIGADENYGGQGLPNIIATALGEYTSSANMAWAMYTGLTHGAYASILAHGTDEQKQTYLPKMVSGEWTGTMNLTEPHCGTDLGLLRTKAEPNPDGTYNITGQKIFISAGEHDMADNIIHLVLARVTGAPEGTKGISLFIVPKFILNDDGSLGARNSLSCGKIEEKMGIHGNSTCVMNYDGAKGFLIGEMNKGLNAMFVMMNEARLGVGLQGLSQSEAAYQSAVTYAKDRIQGRSLTGAKNPDKPADPLMVHPDVRRMLMDAKAFNEGGRAFLLWTALQGDLSHVSPDEAQKTKSADFMALLTPVVKGYLTDKGFQTAVNCQQVYGGHGYIEEWGMSQYVRDARIAMIYEGANGVQALDLVGRKLAQNGGRAVQSFFAELDGFIKENSNVPELAPYTTALATTKGQLMEATMWLMQNGMTNFDNAGAASTDYMHLFGITTLTYMWALMAKASIGKDGVFYTTKLKTGRYFIERITPDAAAHLAKLKTGAAVVMALNADEF